MAPPSTRFITGVGSQISGKYCLLTGDILREPYCTPRATSACNDRCQCASAASMRCSWITLNHQSLSSALFLHYSPRVQGSGRLISHVLKNSARSSPRLLRPIRSALHLITSSGTQRRVGTQSTGENNLTSTITQLRNNA